MYLATVTKHLTFDSAHYLVNKEWDREKNIARFHKCCLYKEDGSDESHGHTYHLYVSVTGYVDEDTGFVVDFKDLKSILNDGIIETVDHRLLNNIPWFKESNKLATVENILHYVWETIWKDIDRMRPKQAWLAEIKMYETPNSYAVLDRKQWIAEQRELVLTPIDTHVDGEYEGNFGNNSAPSAEPWKKCPECRGILDNAGRCHDTDCPFDILTPSAKECEHECSEGYHFGSVCVKCKEMVEIDENGNLRSVDNRIGSHPLEDK